MKENITYSECLSGILSAMNMRSSKLSREINIDSSLIYKWLRNERVPSNESPYIELILDSIMKRLDNLAQRKAVIELLTRYEVPLSSATEDSLRFSLRLFLQSSQNYSLKVQKKLKHSRNSSTIKAHQQTDTGTMIDTEKEDPSALNRATHRSAMQLLGKTKAQLAAGHDKVQIISGSLEIICSIINLLLTAMKKHNSREPILLTCNSDLLLSPGAQELARMLIQIMEELLRSGQEIILLVKVDDNGSRTVRIIENLHLLSAGNLKVYYHKSAGESSFNKELCIVPKSGAICGFSTQSEGPPDSAFLFQSKQSIEIWSAKYYQDLSAAAPLLKAYPPQDSYEFQKVFADIEEYPGNKYVFKEGLSTTTMPSALYEKYLKLTGITGQELSYRIHLHNRRLEAFHVQIRSYQYKDIYFIEAIEELIEKNKYSFDENYILRNIKPDNIDILCQLEYLVYLLQTYENYEIAFISKSDYPHIANINWMVKRDGLVMIETYHHAIKKDASCQEKNFTIADKNIVKAFHNHFLFLWAELPGEAKDKKKVIKRLRHLIKQCRKKSEHSLSVDSLQ
jgi:hypothetical protein